MQKLGKERNEKRMGKKLLSWCIVLSMISTAVPSILMLTTEGEAGGPLPGQEIEVPTLGVYGNNSEGAGDTSVSDPNVNIEYPKKGYIYIFDQELMPLGRPNTVIIGWYSGIVVRAYDDDGLNEASLYVDGELVNTTTLSSVDATICFTYLEWGSHFVQVIVTDDLGNEGSDDMNIQIFFPNWGAPVISSAMDSNVLQLKTNEIEGTTEKNIECDQGPESKLNFLCKIEISGEGYVEPVLPSGAEPLVFWKATGYSHIAGVMGKDVGDFSSGFFLFFSGQAIDDPTVEISGVALIAYYTIY